jgi:4-hydroxythreonine-4-phosphate dehydrogenase
MNKNLVLGISIGDSAGIGPEVALKAACRYDWPDNLRLVLIGSRNVLRKLSRKYKIKLPPSWNPAESSVPNAKAVNWEPAIDFDASDFGVRTRAKLAELYIKKAVEGCKSGLFAGMVTAPVCKENMQAAEIDFPGHTEYIARMTNTDNYAMMLAGGGLRVVLVTRHLPVARVSAAISKKKIINTAVLTWQAVNWLRLKNKAIGVCGLNPHAGDGGVIGREEINIISPAIETLRSRGMEISGPVPADVIFYQARRQKKFGVVLSMYHDQGLGPLKMVGFNKGINLTLGLPIVRTSPDHGTAFDIAGKGIANPGSMIEAIRKCSVLAKYKNPWKK